jgi:hypothetical protein
VPKKPEPNPEQLEFGTSNANIPRALPSQFSPNQHLSTARLLTAHSKLHVIEGIVTFDDQRKSDPEFLFWGLHVLPTDPAFDSTMNLSRLGVRKGSNNQKLWPQDYGLMFPPDEYRVAAHNPEGIANRVYARTAARSQKGELPSAKDARAKRSAGHALDTTMKNQVTQGLIYREELKGFGVLVRDATRKSGASVKAKNLELLRANADERIHQMVEGVGLRFEQSDKEIAGVHKAVRRRIYNGNFSSAERLFNFIDYIHYLGAYTTAKRARLVLAYTRTRDEHAKYKPYIDEEKARLKAQAAA